MERTREEKAPPDTVVADDVLECFNVYQAKTAPMVAQELNIDRQQAEELLEELAAVKELTKARAGTSRPVWIRPYHR